MDSWKKRLKSDPLAWLLERDNPAVRRFALTDLLDRSPTDPEVVEAAQAVNASRPIKKILAAQQPEGYWVTPGPGYSPKYRATVWQVIFLDQLGAHASDAHVRAACEYVLSHTQAANGGFGASGQEHAAEPSNSAVIHCLNGNLLRALLGFGFADDARVQRAIEWQARAITGDQFSEYYSSGTSGPGFQCASNYGAACAWGAVKALRAPVRVPASLKTAQVKKAMQIGSDFLLGHDPAIADYPAGKGKISANWFKLGFPSGYASDVLQNLETLAELGHARDKRLRPAIDWLLSKQDAAGRWKNQNSYAGRGWTSIEPQGAISKWVTLRACRVLKAVG